MSAAAIMFLGTGSDVGKSLVVAGIARALANRGLKVAPFKPQNMSNNAAVTSDGGEIGRAQALQARAARQAATVHMNPVLLKPESTTGAQVIVQGKRVATLQAREFFRTRQTYMPAIVQSFGKLQAEYDVVLVEGAGSPAEVNLRDGDLANLGFARAANIPCVLIGDIHRGGVIASIIGTLQVLSEADRGFIKGFIINKFHGDVSLFDEGRTYLEQHGKIPCIGILPHFAGAHRLPAEDALALETVLPPGKSDDHKIAVLRLPRIANFDDIDPLRATPGVSVQFVQAGTAIPGDVSLVIIPGSKTTISDLAALRANGWDIDLMAHVRRGGHVLGLCGGYQMLGKTIGDPQGLEGPAQTVAGLGLLDVETLLTADKTLTEVRGTHCDTAAPIHGYEIHLGQTSGADTSRPFATINGKAHGAQDRTGRIAGTYMHGCFAADAFRAAYLAKLGIAASTFSYDADVDATLDALARHVEKHLDLDALLRFARP